jgi:hypothetical protein
MIHPDDDFPYVYFVDDYANTDDDVIVGATPSLSGRFKSYYRTSWFDDRAYVQLKTFIRPYFVFKDVSTPTAITLNRYRNFDETNQVGGTRTIALTATAAGGTYSVDGSGGVYDTAVYGFNTGGAVIKRKGVAPLGRGFAIQLEFMGPDDDTDSTVFPGRQWGLNSIAYKFKRRKIRST